MPYYEIAGAIYAFVAMFLVVASWAVEDRHDPPTAWACLIVGLVWPLVLPFLVGHAFGVYLKRKESH